jgi:hypothetical protein
MKITYYEISEWGACISVWKDYLNFSLKVGTSNAFNMILIKFAIVAEWIGELRDFIRMKKVYG